MKCLRVEPDKAPEVIEIESTLKSYQEQVGGYIEAVYPWEDPVALICNEEGKILELPCNRSLRDDEERVYDIVCGTFLIVGLGDDDFIDLSDEYIDKYAELFKDPEDFDLLRGVLYDN